MLWFLSNEQSQICLKKSLSALHKWPNCNACIVLTKGSWGHNFLPLLFCDSDPNMMFQNTMSSQLVSTGLQVHQLMFRLKLTPEQTRLSLEWCQNQVAWTEKKTPGVSYVQPQHSWALWCRRKRANHANMMDSSTVCYSLFHNMVNHRFWCRPPPLFVIWSDGTVLHQWHPASACLNPPETILQCSLFTRWHLSTHSTCLWTVCILLLPPGPHSSF